MASPVLAVSHQDLSLQKQAIDSARLAFSRLPRNDAFFQKCIGDTDSIPDIVRSVVQESQAYKCQKSTRLLQRFQRYTLWLHNISDVIDIAVQTQAGIGCPLWAPIKFVLKVSKDHSQAAEAILRFIETISENLPRFDIYERLQSEHVLQIALLNIFTDVVAFSLHALKYFRRGPFVRFCKLLVLPFEEEFGDIIGRIKRHSKIVDSTAVAIEMLKAAEFRKETILKDRENMKIQLEGWLKPSNVRAIHQSQVQARLPGTGNWIWQNSTFKQWMQSSLSSASGRLLCISGTHGCGKSVLASSILEGLEQRTLFFSFSGTDTGRQSFDSLVRSFIWQLLQSNANDESHEIMRGLMLRGQPLVSELWESFIAAAALASTPFYCIIDGVDECRDSIQTLLEHILKLLSSQAKFRVLLLGRPPLLRTTESERSQTIEIDSDLIKQDVDAYIDAEIGRHDILKSPRLRDTVAEALKEKSEGMFLWVKLMVDDLRKSDNLAQVEDRLCDLPRGIEKAYRLHFNRLIEQLDPYQLALAKNVFDLAIASLRPLEVEEFRHAHALHSGYSVPSDENLLMEPERRILAVCGGLIKITNGIIRPIHFSMKEYLLRPEDEWLRNDESRIMAFRVDFQDSHRSLGSICAKYLTICDYGSPLSATDHFVQLQLRYPMLRYASLYGASHLTRSGPPYPATVQNIRHFLGSEKCASWIEYVGMLAIEEASAITPLDEVERFMAWLGQGGYKEEFLIADFLRCINQELEKRIRQFGEYDWRTEQCQLFLGILQESTSNSDVEEVRVSESASPTQQIISNGPDNLSRILTALTSNSDLPVHRGVNIFLRLQYHLRHAKVLTDPLKMLFRIILQKVPIIPIYALVVIAEWYCRIEKLEEALQVYRAALAKVGGQEIPLAFNISASIGRILILQNKYEEAEVICGQTLKLGQQLLGKENEDTLQSAHELGYVLGAQEKYEEGEAIYKSTLKLRQKVLGKEHKGTLRSAHNLSFMLHNQGRFEEAEALLRQTLKSKQEVLGKENEGTLKSAHELGYVLGKQEKYEEAEAIYKLTLKSREKVLGKEHKDTLLSAHCLSTMLRSQGKFEEAEALIRPTLKLRQKVLGTENEDTLQSAHSLSVILFNQGEFEEAEPLIRQTLELRQKVFGKEHEDTLQSAHVLGYVLSEQEKYEEAERLSSGKRLR